MSNLINKEMIVLDMEAETKEEVIEKLAKLIEKQGKLENIDEYIAQVLKREEEYPTSVGFDVSIPHGKCDAVKCAAVAFARLKKPVAWSSEEQVKYIFLLAVPEKGAGNTHLQILAQLSRKIMRDEFRKKLQASNSVEEIELTLDI